MTCRGICKRYKATGSPTKGRYSSGHKRCNHCEIYLICMGLYCPCCRFRLRTKPRNKKYKEKHAQRIKNQQRILIESA